MIIAHPNTANVNGTDVIEVPSAPTEARITHVLQVFPYLSGSMLQVGIGTSMRPTEWKPVLEKMVEEGKVKRHQVKARTPKGNDQLYTVYHLNTVRPYTEVLG